MGSRGSGTRREGGGGLNPANIVNERDMVSMVAEGDRRREAKEVLSVSDAMIREYGDDVQIYTFNVAELKGKDAYSVMAYYDGANIAINKNYFDANHMEEAYANTVRQGFHPSNGNKTAMEAVAAHEYGHALTDFAAKQMGVGDLHSAADRIVKEARRATTHRGVVQMAKAISGYATHSNAEAVAEAVADVYCNGSRAKAESRAIVNTLNNYLKRR